MTKQYVLTAEYWGEGEDSYWDYTHNIQFDEETISRFLMDMGIPSDAKDGDLKITVALVDSPKVLLDRNS